MRVLTLVLLFSLLLVAIEGKKQNPTRCKGKPRKQKCEGLMDLGVGGKKRCRNSANKAMWYYDGRSKNCTIMDYKGCKGNANRWCTKQNCEAKCRR